MCPICRAPGALHFWNKNSRQMLLCPECRHVFWDSMPSAAELNAYYERVYTSTHHQATQQEENREYAKSHCLELLHWSGTDPESTTFLDYGCSIPVILDVARQMGFAKTIGVDPSSAAREYAAARGFEVLPLDALDQIPDASCDIARLVHVIEHTTDPVAVLSAVARKVRPGGIVHISQPNFPVFAPLPAALELPDSVYPEHLHFFSPISLARLLDSAGLEVRRLFSFQNEEQAAKKYAPMMDLLYTRKRMINLAARGDNYFPKLANYPFYAGENSVVWAARP